MLKNRYGIWNNGFKADHVNFWSHLSRFNNLLVIMNISMFFLTGLVARGYYYTAVNKQLLESCRLLCGRSLNTISLDWAGSTTNPCGQTILRL